ncbi:uncharacterized protein LOC127705961 [Mytilus californianus]|uniref:uncharacterized protein LOC127705961 n=1 Tax=Mytilus californianus TaxID=6549 RepID=UPI002247E424|nr:uncharacterized protein LOC127705961 [Mytilus californianus]
MKVIAVGQKMDKKTEQEKVGMKRISKFRHGINKPCERKSLFRTVKDLITPTWLSRLFTSEKQHESNEAKEEDTRTMSVFGSLKDLLTPSWLSRYITLKPGKINTQDSSKDFKNQTNDRDKQQPNVKRPLVIPCNQKNNTRCSDTCFQQSTLISHTRSREDIYHQQDQIPVQTTGIFSSSQLPLHTENINERIDNDDNFSNISDYSGCSSGYSSMNPHQPTSIQEKKALIELNNNASDTHHNSDYKKNLNWSAQYNTKRLRKSSLTEKSSSGLNLFPKTPDESAAILSKRLIENEFYPGTTFGRSSPQKRRWNENCSPISQHKIPARQKMQARYVTSSINSSVFVSSGAKNMHGTLEKLKTDIEEFHITSTEDDMSSYDKPRKDKFHSVGKESHYSNIDNLSVVSSSTDKELEAQDECQIRPAGFISKSDMTSDLNGNSKSSSEFNLTGDCNRSAKFGEKSTLNNNGFIVEKRLIELSERMDQPQSCKNTYSKELPKTNDSPFSTYYELQSNKPLETEIISEINESTISKEYVIKDKSEVMVKSSDNDSRENTFGDTITFGNLGSSPRLSRTPILGTSETVALTSQISETSTQNVKISTMAAAIPRTSTPSFATSWVSASASQTSFGKSIASTSFFTISETSKVLIGNSNKSTLTVGLPQSTLPIYSTSQTSIPTFATSLVSTVTFGTPQTSTFANSMVSIPTFNTPQTLAPTTSTSLLSIPAFGTHLTSAPTTSTSLLSTPAFGTHRTSAPTTSTSLLSTPAFGTHLTSAPTTSTSLLSTPAFGTHRTSAPTTSTSPLSPPAFGTDLTSAPTTSTSLLSTPAFGTHRTSAPTTSASLLLPPAFGTDLTSAPTTKTSLLSTPAFGTHRTSAPTTSTSLLSTPAFGTHRTSAPNTSTSVALTCGTIDTSASILAPMVTSSTTLGTHKTSETDRMTFGKIQTSSSICKTSSTPIQTSGTFQKSLATFRQPQVTTVKPEMLNTPPMFTMLQKQTSNFETSNIASAETSKLRTTETLNLTSRESPITTPAFGISHSSPILSPEKERSLQAKDTCTAIFGTAQKSRSKFGTSEASVKVSKTSQSPSLSYEAIHKSVSAFEIPLIPKTIFERSQESSSFESSSTLVPRSTFTKIQTSKQKLGIPEISSEQNGRLSSACTSGDVNCDAGIKKDLAYHVPSTKKIETFIPEYRKPLVSRPIDLNADDCNVSVVTFDLETTGFGYDAEIVQISAEVVQITSQIVEMEVQTFQEYILPTKPINPKASEVTGLYSDGCSLFYKGQKVNTLSKSGGLKKFIKWLPHKVVLVAHNSKIFDSKIIVSQLSSVNLVNELQCKVFGFSDTLHIFRQKYPDRKSYKQENLVKDILNRSYNAHNAVDDVQLLNQLMKNSKVSLQDIINHSFTVKYVHNYLIEFRHKKARLNTFKPVYMSDEPVMSKSLCERAAESGLKLGHLNLAISCDDFDGLHRLFSEIDEDGNVRVTKMKRIIKNVYNFLTAMK